MKKLIDEGITFDTGSGGTYWDWELDWSLRGADVSTILLRLEEAEIHSSSFIEEAQEIPSCNQNFLTQSACGQPLTEMDGAMIMAKWCITLKEKEPNLCLMQKVGFCQIDLPNGKREIECSETALKAIKKTD